MQPEVDVETISQQLQNVGNVGVQGCIRQYGELSLAQLLDAGLKSGRHSCDHLQEPPGTSARMAATDLADSPA